MINEQSNPYVDHLCNHVALLWKSLVESRSVPSAVKDHAWELLIQSGYLALLDGFARVSYCSTEGRSLMSMDLASFATGTSPQGIKERNSYQVSGPPAVTLARGKEYVDAYIKASYLPKGDMMEWIANNHQDYPQNYCLSLISAVVQGTEANDMICKVQSIYSDGLVGMTQRSK